MSSLRLLFSKLIAEYSDIYNIVYTTQDYKNPFGVTIRHDIPDAIKASTGIDGNDYIVKGSHGAGRWTSVPWVAVFDKRITSSAQKGIYIVYLLNKDTKELYLTLNQGATDVAQTGISTDGKLAFTGIASAGGNKTTEELKRRANNIRTRLDIPTEYSNCVIKTGSEAYDAGCICSVKYTLDNLPEEEKLTENLKDFIKIYSQYYNVFYSATAADWWPSQEEYDLKLTKEDWIEYLTKIEIPNHLSPVKMLIAMLELGGEASCKQLAEIYGGHPTAYIGCAMNFGYRVRKYFNLPECVDDGQNRYFAFPFLGKKDSSSGNYIYKIRPELVEALNEIDLSNINPYYDIEDRVGKFDSWDIINEYTAVKHCDKSFFEYNGSGVPKGILWFFEAEDLEKSQSKAVKIICNSREFTANVVNDSTDRQRVQIRWNSDLGNLLKLYRSDETLAIFNKQDLDTYELIMKAGEKELTTKEAINHIKSYISSKGFTYEDGMVENFYLSLKSKPFVILAGTSGTGKTRLVKLFSEAIGAKMELVPVRPDWSDSSDLFGHNDISCAFHPGAIIDFVKKANDNKDTPFILCLDEMNLARVEYYLSDFLSIIETRDKKNGEITTDPLIKSSYFKDTKAAEDYGQLYLSENLYIVGTVNMDETTFPFSKKVLDRANTIEFSFVNLTNRIHDEENVPVSILNNSFLKTEYLYLKDCGDENLIDSICLTLEQINQILLKANLHVGYRVRDEICFYMMNNKKADLLAEDMAFDREIMQKILPRIQGSSMAIKDALCELFIKCAGDYTTFSGLSVFEQMNSYIDSGKDCKYPNSAKKIAFMMRRYEEDGFTSYWL